MTCVCWEAPRKDRVLLCEHGGDPNRVFSTLVRISKSRMSHLSWSASGQQREVNVG